MVRIGNAARTIISTNWLYLAKFRLFQHRVMVGGSSPEADRIGSVFRKRRLKCSILPAGCLDGRDARVCRDPKRHGCIRGEGAVDTRQHCRRTGPSSGLSAGPIRSGPDGADALSWLEPAWIARRLRRKPAGSSGAEVTGNAQD